MREKWLTPCKAETVLGGGNTLFIKIEIKCPAVQNLEIKTFKYLQTLVLWLFDFVPPLYTYSPFILGKLTWSQKILEVSSDSPLPPIMPWLRGFAWYAWPYNDIFHTHHLTSVFFGKLPISARVLQKSNLNQIDGWVSILWEHLNCIQQQKRTPFRTWVT